MFIPWTDGAAGARGYALDNRTTEERLMRKDSNDPAKIRSPERQGDHGRTTGRSEEKSVLRWGGLAGILGGILLVGYISEDL